MDKLEQIKKKIPVKKKPHLTRRSTKTVKSPKKLTLAQQLKREEFCKQYVLCQCNQTEAYKKVYPNVKNDNVACVNAHHLLNDPKMRERIKELKEQAEEATGLSKTFMIDKLAKVATGKKADPKDIVSAFKLIADILGYTQKQAAHVIIQQNNLFGDAEKEFKKSIEI